MSSSSGIFQRNNSLEDRRRGIVFIEICYINNSYLGRLVDLPEEKIRDNNYLITFYFL